MHEEVAGRRVVRVVAVVDGRAAVGRVREPNSVELGRGGGAGHVVRQAVGNPDLVAGRDAGGIVEAGRLAHGGDRGLVGGRPGHAVVVAPVKTDAAAGVVRRPEPIAGRRRAGVDQVAEVAVLDDDRARPGLALVGAARRVRPPTLGCGCRAQGLSLARKCT